MIIRIKQYTISIQKTKLIVMAKKETGNYKLIFPISRTNPLTYIKPFFILFFRKFFPKRYFEIYSYDKEWNICSICHEVIGNQHIGGFLVCAGCKSMYDNE